VAPDKAFERFVSFSPVEWEDFRRKGDALSAKLASLGWTIPMHMQPADAWEAADKPTPAEVDAVFVAHYQQAEGRYFERVVDELLSETFLEAWRPLIDECGKAYKQGLYRITIPSLFACLEGSVVALGGKGKIIQRCEEHRRVQDPESLKRMLWASFAPFVETVFEDGRSSSGDVINRNLILHGHSSPADWTTADALRLFNALHLLAAIAR
jgi:hypothetical protein